MIPIKFEYYKPDTLEEAFSLFSDLNSRGKKPFYYSGGTEIISMARANNLHMWAVIDIKGIPECSNMGINNEKLIIGSAVTLTQISESKLFPLLGLTAARIADHTIQGKITIGGNLFGTIIYRETSLPLLLSDCSAAVYSMDGIHTVPINEIFNKKLILKQGEILVNLIIDTEYTKLPYIHVKKTKNEKISYPLLTVAAIKKDKECRIAFSGLCNFPFRSSAIENRMNDNSQTHEGKINSMIEALPYKILGDIIGSADYRRFVLYNTLDNTLKMLKKV